MERIINHWTAGNYQPTEHDKQCYHVLIDGNGNEVQGFYNPEANENTKDGHYAAHTLACNTGSIGVSCCAMAGAVEKPFDAGDAPLKEIQWRKMIEINARFCKQYHIEPGPKTVLTHAEVEANLGKKQRGKWDISRLPWLPSVIGAKAVGDLLRAEVKKAMPGINKPSALMIKPKPILQSRNIQMLLGSLGGSSGIVGQFSGWDWRALVAMAGLSIVVFAVFAWRYRREIAAGMFIAPK